MSRFIVSSLLAVLLLGLHHGPVAAKNPAPALPSELAVVFEPWQRSDAPGIAVGILKDGEVLFSGGFGSANLEHGVAIGADTVFDIASVSKQFAGLAVAMLVLDGKLALDDDIRQYVPEVPDFGPTITVQHLLHHTSGVRDWVGLMVMSGVNPEDVISMEQIMRLLQRQSALNFAPGDAMSYSNSGYNILARLVEVVSGQSFPDWTAQHIFQPLGMHDTYFPVNHDMIRRNRADSYSQNSDGSFKRQGNQLTALGSSSLHTTVNDLLKWLQNFESGKVGGRAALDLMTTPAKLNNGEPSNYGFGLDLNPWRGLTRISHGGSWAGFRTWIGYFPESRLGVVVLGNYDRFDSSRTGLAIAETLLGNQEVPDAGSEAKSPQESPQNPTKGKVQASWQVKAEQLDEYAGHYYVEAAGFLFPVVREGDGLFLTMPIPAKLVPTSKDTFNGEETNLTLSFQRDPTGKVSDVTIKLGGNDMAGKRMDSSLESVHATDYPGDYYSRELNTTYTVVLRADALYATHQRHPDMLLFPNGDDRFVSDTWYLPTIEFVRADDGKVSGLSVSAPRVRNVVFERQRSQ